ncbi:hypothetical protein [Schinkia azotoformans]|nr:hypothetical protein [Schinkia azotoformans]MEC1787962.1 hypothetical protein [Schinkia azotoformans]
MAIVGSITARVYNALAFIRTYFDLGAVTNAGPPSRRTNNLFLSVK